MMENQLVPDTVAAEDVSIYMPVTPQLELTRKTEAEQEDLGPFVGSGNMIRFQHLGVIYLSANGYALLKLTIQTLKTLRLL